METKLSPRFFEGVKYISLYDLPHDQVNMFSEWVSTSGYVNQQTSSRIGSNDLVHYEDYEYWFNNHYLTEKDWDQIL
jgi:hypothetical protein